MLKENYQEIGERSLDYVIKPLTRFDATEFVQDHHYSPVMPRLTKVFLGFHLEEELVGVLTLGYGTQPKGTAKKIFDCEVDEYFEIGKMCILDDLGTNAESMMVARTESWIKQQNQKFLSLKNKSNYVHGWAPNEEEKEFLDTWKMPKKYLYTMADGGMGKVGYCYQASNFYYGGKFDTPIFCTPDMEKVHIRTMRQFLTDNNEFLPETDHRKVKYTEDEDGKKIPVPGSTRKHVHLCWPTQEYLDHTGWSWYKVYMYRYALPLTKGAKRELEGNPMWKRGGPGVYPKDTDLQFLKRTAVTKTVKGVTVTGSAFVKVPKPEFNLSLENIKVNKKNVIEHKS